MDESRYVRNAVLGRLRQASYGSDARMAALSFGGPQTAFQDEGPGSVLAYANSPLPVKAPPRAPAASRDIVFWAEGVGAWGRFDSDGNAASVRRDLAGFISGVDTRAGDNGRAGIAAGYTGSRNRTDGRGSANVDTAHLAAYGGWSFGAFNLRGGGAFAWHSIDTSRTIAFPGLFDRASAQYDGRTGQVFGEIGYGFAFRQEATFNRRSSTHRTFECLLMADFVEKVRRRGWPRFFRVMEAFSEQGRGGSHRLSASACGSLYTEL